MQVKKQEKMETEKNAASEKVFLFFFRFFY